MRSIPWNRLWPAAVWLFKTGSTWLKRNLTAEEQRELASLMTKSRGRRTNLTPREQKRFAELVRKAIFGSGPGGSTTKRAGRRRPKP